MKGRVLFLYNVNAGRGHIADNVGAISDIFRSGGYSVEARAIEFGRNPFEGCGEVDLVVAAGGDGTLNYVINNMKAEGLDFTLAVIPAGTANDFAGAIGMDSCPFEAARQIVEGSVKEIDCGRVNGLYYVNIFSFGLFTTTSQHTSDGVKHRIGRLAYIFEGLKELKDMHSIPLHVSTDEGEFSTEAVIALIFNGETAGRFPLARGASISDGLLDVIFMEKTYPGLLGWSILRYLLGGQPSSIRHFRSRNIRISSPLEGITTDADGQRGVDFPLHVECLHKELRVICPR